MIRRAVWICLSGMALISASRVAGAEPPPPSAAPGDRAATPPPLALYPYPYGYPHGYWQNVPPAPTLEASAPTQRYWYGWQTLIVFGTSGALVVAESFAGGISAPLSLGGFMLGGPIVHWAHGNVKKGLVSLGINLGGMLVVGLTATVACNSLCKGGSSLGSTAAIVGGGAGLLIANVIDVAVLSYDQRPAVYRDAAARRPSVTWLPTFDVGKGRASVGLMGTF